MKNIPIQIEEKIQDHLRTLQMQTVGWIRNEKDIVEWVEKKMMFYGDVFLELKLKNGDVLEFSYKPSEGTEYCLCDEHSQDYNHIHNCSGNNCDWEIPLIKKHSPDGTEEICVFTGKQKELWN